MNWETGIIQDRDGYWVDVLVGDFTTSGEKIGPFSTEDEAKASELRIRLELHRVHGSPLSP